MTTEQIVRASAPPVDDVCRTASFGLRDDSGDGEPDGRTLDGYAAVFEQETVIDSWEGRFREKIAPGSMRKSFRESPPVIQFDHGSHPLIGSIPIARLDSIAEDVDPVLAPRGGAHVIATLHDNWLIEPLRDAISSRSIKGMSFRFAVVRDEWHDHKGAKIKPEDLGAVLRATWSGEIPDDELPLRTLKELKVRELGPVVFPAYAGTSVDVRSQVIDLSRLDDPEQRRLLARAVLLADVAEADDADPSTPLDTREAVEHLDESNDTPQDTGTPAVEHLSGTRLDRRHALAECDEVWASIHSTKGRYS